MSKYVIAGLIGLITYTNALNFDNKAYSSENKSSPITNYEETDIRQKIINDSKEKFNVQLFGTTLNNIEKKVMENIEYCKNNKKEICEIEYEIPSNFLVLEMDLRIEVNTKEIRSKIYQKLDNTEIILADFPVAIGGKNKDYQLKKIRDFATPKGTYYIQRIVQNPYYYPPKWDKNTKKINPGKNNPYGIWMAELVQYDKTGNYAFSVNGDIGIRIHSTNNKKSMGKKVSHGCVRIHPTNANELFQALLRYTPHKEMKKNERGEITPLLKTIKVDIF